LRGKDEHDGREDDAIRNDPPLEVDGRQYDQHDGKAGCDDGMAAQAETLEACDRKKRTRDRDGRPATSRP
jgi:hypothetical protein